MSLDEDRSVADVGRRETETRAVYFGTPAEPLFGWLHLPAGGRAVAGVVLCPPLGVELLSAYKGLRQLAVELSGAGLAVLRFDYRGTGDSAGDGEGPGRVEAWTADAAEAVALLRRLGAVRVGIVGLRMGALLAARAASAATLDAAVLWDPCNSGRSFVREQAALRALSLGDGDAPDSAGTGKLAGLEILGTVLSAGLVAELEALDLAGVGRPPASSLLAVLRAERRPGRALAATLESWGAELCQVTGQADFVDALPDSSEVGTATLDLIAAWLADRLGGEATTLELSQLPDPAASFVEHGARLRERALRLGPLGLAAIESVPDRRSCGPTMLFLNAGLIHHCGPSRLWVDWSRRLAAAGMRAVRVDLSGLGDSPARPGQRREVVYPLEALDDIAVAIKALEEQNSDGVVLSGLCAGAYHSIEGGIAFGARGVVAVNPFLSFDPEEVRAGGELATGRNAVRPYDSWIRPLLRYRRLVDLGDRHTPAALWWLLARLGLYTSPAVPIERLAEQGVRVQLICGDLESRQFTRRGRWTLRRLERSGLVRLTTLPGSDHTLFGAAARARATEVMLAFVLEHFGPASAPRCDPRAAADLAGLRS